MKALSFAGTFGYWTGLLTSAFLASGNDVWQS